MLYWPKVPHSPSTPQLPRLQRFYLPTCFLHHSPLIPPSGSRLSKWYSRPWGPSCDWPWEVVLRLLSTDWQSYVSGFHAKEKQAQLIDGLLRSPNSQPQIKTSNLKGRGFLRLARKSLIYNENGVFKMPKKAIAGLWMYFWPLFNPLSPTIPPPYRQT